MGRATVAGGRPAMAAPSRGILLKDLAEGSVVKISENGTPVDFYVACHNYESAQNGAGRTLLVRKDVKENTEFDTKTGYRVYPESGFAVWMSDYSELLDESVRNAVSTTKIQVATALTEWTGFTVEYGSYATFPLSVTELGYSSLNSPVEGSVLPTASILLAVKMDGAAATQWTRSLWNGSGSIASTYYVDKAGEIGVKWGGQGEEHGARPCFTLPENALFDEETLEFKGVA